MKKHFPHPNKNGFTLIELMLTIGIVGILVAIAIPSYYSYMRESQRTDATQTLLDYANRQEIYFSQHNTYTTDFSALGIPQNSPEGFYRMRISDCGININACYEISAKARRRRPQRKDTDCRIFVLARDGSRTATSASGSDTSDVCW